MEGTVNQTEKIEANNATGGTTHAAWRGGDDSTKLREQLAMARRELAHARLHQESLEERLAILGEVQDQREKLAQLLVRLLSLPAADPVSIGGLRGWVARRILGPPLPRPGDGDPRVEMIEASGFFDAAWYLCTYPDVAESGGRPAVHYLYHGALEGRAAGPRFDTAFYLARYPDVRESGINPLVHYLQSGRQEGRLAAQSFYGDKTAMPGDGS